MNMNLKKISYIGCIIGVLIMLAPILVTGNFLLINSNAIGALLVSEFIMRVISLIVGLIIIYDSIKTLNKYID